MSNATNATLSEQLDKETILDKTEAAYLLGETIFIIIMMIVGFMGNLVVLIIYSFRMKPSNSRTFILFLFTIDMCINTLGMPLYVVMIFRPFTHATTAFCKMLFFVNYYFLAASLHALLVIAVER